MAADSISQHLKFIEAFSSNLEQVNKNMVSFNSKLEGSVGNFKEMHQESENITVQYNDINKKAKENLESTGKWLDKLKTVGSTIKNTIIPALGLTLIGGGLFDVIKGTLDLDNAMVDLSFRMGKTSGSAKELKNATMSIAQASGITTENASELVGALTRLRVPLKNVKQLGIDVAMFAEETGVSAEESSRLAGNLMRVGRLGQKSVSGILSGMIKVQQTIGLTEGEMSNLSDSIIYSSKMLQQMGKNAVHIEKFSKGTTKLAAAFAQVGIEAQAATQFIENLLDPGRIEDNALLYAKLGISIEDAISGNVDPGKLASKFKNLGQELQAMSGPAAAAMAESLGMPLGQLRQMAEMDMSELEKTLGGTGNASEEIAKAQADALSTQEKFEKATNRVKNLFIDVMDSLMPIVDLIADLVHDSGKDLTGMIKGWVDSFKASGGIEKFVGKIKEGINFLKQAFDPKKLFGKVILGVAVFSGLALIIKKRFGKTMFSVGKNISKTIATGIEEGMNMGSQKASIIMERKLGKKAEKVAADLQMRIRMGEGYETIQRMADKFHAMSKSSMFIVGKKFSLFMEKSLRSASELTKPFSKIRLLTEQNNKKIYEQMLIYKESGIVQDEMHRKRKDEIVQQNILYQQRIDYLNKQIGSKNMTIEEEEELVKLRKMQKQLGAEIKSVNNERSADEKFYANLQLDQLKRIGEEKLRELKIEAEMKKELAIKDIQLAKNTMRGHQLNLDIVNKELEATKKKVNTGEASYFQLKKLQEEQIKLRNIIQEQDNILEQSQSEINRMVKSIKQIDKAAGKNISTMAGSGKILETAGGKFKRFMLSSKNLLISAGKDILIKGKNMGKALKEGAKDALKTIKEMGVKGVFEGMKGALFGRRDESGQKVGGNLGKAIGGVAKIFGPVMLIAGLLRRIKPVQEAINEIMKSLKPLIESIGELFSDLITDVVGALLPTIKVLVTKLLFPLIKTLMPPLLDLLGFLIDILGSLIEALGYVAGVFSKEVGDNLKDLGGSMKDAAYEMRIAASEMRVSNELAGQSISTQIKTNAFLKEANKITKDVIGVDLESMNISALSDAEKKLMNQKMILALQETANAFTEEKRKEDRKLMRAQLESFEKMMNKNMKATDGLKGSLNKYTAEQIAGNNDIQAAWDKTLKDMIKGKSKEEAEKIAMMFKDLTPEEWRSKGKAWWGMDWEGFINGSNTLQNNLESLLSTQQDAYAKQLGFEDWNKLMASGPDVDVLKKVQDLQTKMLKEQEEAGKDLEEVATNTNPTEQITSWEAANLYASGAGIIEREKIREITKGSNVEQKTSNNTETTANNTETTANNTNVIAKQQVMQVKEETKQTEILQLLSRKFDELIRILKTS